jgi:hypothetical protein
VRALNQLASSFTKSLRIPLKNERGNANLTESRKSSKRDSETPFQTGSGLHWRDFGYRTGTARPRFFALCYFAVNKGQ